MIFRVLSSTVVSIAALQKSSLTKWVDSNPARPNGAIVVARPVSHLWTGVILMIESTHSLKSALGFEGVGDDEFNQILSEDFELALPMLQAVIAELARYAIQDIHLERTLDEEGEGTFHSRRFSHWVEQKARARLIPIGVSESNIRRAILCTLGMKPREGSEQEERWSNDDKYRSSYFDTGEIFRIGKGNNLPGPDRYIEINNLVYIVSSKPTQTLVNDFQMTELPF